VYDMIEAVTPSRFHASGDLLIPSPSPDTRPTGPTPRTGWLTVAKKLKYATVVAHHEAGHAVMATFLGVAYSRARLTADGGNLEMADHAYTLRRQPPGYWIGLATMAAAGPVNHAFAHTGGGWLERARSFASDPDLNIIAVARERFVEQYPHLEQHWPRCPFVEAAHRLLFVPGLKAATDAAAKLLQITGELDHTIVGEVLAEAGVVPAPFPDPQPEPSAGHFVGAGI